RPDSDERYRRIQSDMDGIINQQQQTTLAASRSNGSPDYKEFQNHSIIAAAQNLAFLLQEQQSSSPTGAISNAFPDTCTMETISHWLENQLPMGKSDEMDSASKMLANALQQ
uniref:CSON001956 protein n=1 Tax=Culicoides sonorensis TaxID=179676 RepID=A0A336L135_CULSO